MSIEQSQLLQQRQEYRGRLIVANMVGQTGYREFHDSVGETFDTVGLDRDLLVWRFLLNESAMGKSTFISQDMGLVKKDLQDARKRQIIRALSIPQPDYGIEPKRKLQIPSPKLYYAHFGQYLAIARNLGVVTSPQGQIPNYEYEASGQLIDRIRFLIERYLVGPAVILEDEVLDTKGADRRGKFHGVDRGGLDSFRKILLRNEHARAAIIDLEETQVEENFKFREEMYQAVVAGNFDLARKILKKYKVKDNRAGNNELLQEAYTKTGNRLTREQQDADVARLTYRYIQDGDIDDDSYKGKTESQFVKDMLSNKVALEGLRRTYFYQVWRRNTLGAAAWKCAILDNYPVINGKRHVYGLSLTTHSVIHRLQDQARNPRAKQLRKDLAELRLLEAA